MGCHTWFYEKSKTQPTYEEVRQKYLESIKEELGYYERHVSNTLNKDELSLFENKSIDNSKYSIKVLQRLYRIINNRFCKLATMSHGASVFDLDYSTKTNSFYKKTEEYHDLFRIGGYPEKKLHSMDECLKFFNNNEKNIFWGNAPEFLGKEKVINQLKEFWNKYPDGMIDFG